MSGPDRLRAVADVSRRVGACEDLDHVVTACLDGLAELLGFEHSMLLLVDASPDRLVTVASHGYASAGIGSEATVGVGQGILGLAAAERRTARIGALQRLVQYDRAARGSQLGPRDVEVRLPGLDGVQSQIATPILRAGELLGVLAVESTRGSAFVADDEAVLEVVAQLLADGLVADRDDAESPAPEHEAPLRPAVVPVAGPTAAPLAEEAAADRAALVRFYEADGSTFVDGEYLVKGVPGRILWKLLQEWNAEGRTAFTNRELRRDPQLQLPPFKDNLEARLVLLRRRLDERAVPMRLEVTGRGRFALEVSAPLRLDARLTGAG